ncbi:ECF transporter S component [Proteinivorax hydrogeniformans]|uniref:Riboflavin transporter n=1 Tax=Proteinivorax hydrogeniformans TaxID=1826727 RepID=A0AAU8HU00_9FIRM
MKILRQNERINTNFLVKLSLLAAISYLLTFIRMPLPFFPEFLKIDIAELPALIAGFAFGPIAGVIVVLLRNILDFLTKTSTGGVGELSNFIVGSSFVVTASAIYKLNKSKRNAVLGVVLATVVMACIGLLSNKFIILPLWGMPVEWSFLLTIIVPFNLIKGALNSLVAILIYKNVSRILK